MIYQADATLGHNFARVHVMQLEEKTVLVRLMGVTAVTKSLNQLNLHYAPPKLLAEFTVKLRERQQETAMDGIAFVLPPTLKNSNVKHQLKSSNEF